MFLCSMKLKRLDKMFDIILLVFMVMGASVGSPVSPVDEIAADLTSTTAFNDLLYCKTDMDCPKGSFCGNYVTPICEACYSCQSKNRRFGDPRCARSNDDCGDCIDGYVPVGDPEMKGSCMQKEEFERRSRRQQIVRANEAEKEADQLRHVKGQLDQVDALNYARREVTLQQALIQADHPRLRKVPTERIDSRGDGLMIEPGLFVILAGCCTLTIVLALYIIWSNKRIESLRMLDNEPTVVYHIPTPDAANTCSPSPPPSYRGLSMNHDDDNISCSFELHVVAPATVDCKAIPDYGEDALRRVHTAFQSSEVSSTTSGDNVAPTAPSSETSNTTPTSGSSSSATTPTSGLSASASEADINIHDETTQPSNWTPGADPEIWHFDYLNSYYEDDAEDENGVTSSQQPSKRRSTDDSNSDHSKKRRGG